MIVKTEIEMTGTFFKRADKTTIPNVLPRCLNQDPKFYGALDKPMDLSLGMENFVDEGLGDKFHSIFDYLMKTFPKGSSLKENIDVDFFTCRRILVLIAKSMYDKRGPVEIQALRHKGIIFIALKKDDEPDERNGYGYKFEQNMTLDESGNVADFDAPASNAECTKAVFRTTLTVDNDENQNTTANPIKIFYAAEIDSLDSLGQFTEMKTTRYDYCRWRRFLSLSNYLQSFFGKTPFILYGHLENGCFVDRIHKKITALIPEECNHWDKDVCMETLYRTLGELRDLLPNDGDAVLAVVGGGNVEFHEQHASECKFMEQRFIEHFV